MGRAIDLTGKRFERLVAVRETGVCEAGRVWLWRCDCGAEAEASAAIVRAGRKRSCGCLRREVSSKRAAGQLAGKRFGRLVVVGRAGSDSHRKVVWNCLCDCGRSTLATTGILNKGDKVSCGCFRIEVVSAMMKNRALPENERLARMRLNRVRQRNFRKSDPVKAMQSRISRLHRFALAKVGAIKTSPTMEALGYGPLELKLHLERQFLPGMGWHNMKRWQIDHVVPISEAKTESDVFALNQLSNLRPLWAVANNQKKNRRELLL